MLDLGQAFGLSRWGRLQRLGPAGLEKVVWSPSGTEDAPEMTEDLIDLELPKALKSWAGLSPASRNRKISCLRSFLKWMNEEGFLASDRSSRLECTKVPRKLPHYLSADEAIALVKFLKTQASRSPEAHSPYLLVLLLYGGGLRVSEACQLKWSQIRASQGQVYVRGKGGKERLIVLPQLASSALLQSPHRQDAFIWGSKALNPRTAFQWVRIAGAAAGLIHPLNPHALRHSFATHILSSGANLRILQELLGHTSLAATEKYTHIDIDQLGRTLNQHHPLNKRFKAR